MENCELKRKFLPKKIVKPNFILRSQFSDDGLNDINDDGSNDDGSNDDVSDTLYFSNILCVRLFARLFINITSLILKILVTSYPCIMLAIC